MRSTARAQLVFDGVGAGTVYLRCRVTGRGRSIRHACRRECAVPSRLEKERAGTVMHLTIEMQRIREHLRNRQGEGVGRRSVPLVTASAPTPRSMCGAFRT